MNYIPNLITRTINVVIFVFVIHLKRKVVGPRNRKGTPHTHADWFDHVYWNRLDWGRLEIER